MICITTTLMTRTKSMFQGKMLLVSLALLPVLTTDVAGYHGILPHVAHPLLKCVLVGSPFLILQ